MNLRVGRSWIICRLRMGTSIEGMTGVWNKELKNSTRQQAALDGILVVALLIHSGTKPTPESPSRNPCFRTRVVERLGELNVHLGYAEQYIYCLHDTCIPQQCWSLLPFHSPSRSHRSRSFVNKTTQHSTTFEFNHAIGNEVRHPGCYCAGDVRGRLASI